MSYLGLDIGKKRIGVSRAPQGSKVALHQGILEVSGQKAQIEALLELISLHQPQALVVGLPLQMDGGYGSMAKKVKRFCHALLERCEIEVIYVDERLSSKAVGQVMKRSGMSQKQQRGKVDGAVATLLLQNYLDQQN